MDLNAPHDIRLQHIWSLAVSRVIRAGLVVNDYNVWPAFNALAQLYKDPDGRINVDKNPFPRPEGVPYEFPECPGLVLRWANRRDISSVASVFVQRGNYTQAASFEVVVDAIENPLSWPFIWEYRGELIQFESLTLNRTAEIYLGLTVHMNRMRPHWFWRECERPLWQMLYDRGFTYVQSAVAKNLTLWAGVLREHYKAQITDLHPQNKHLKVQIPVDMTIFSGFPERKTLGPDWKIEYGNLIVREGTEEDLKKLKRVTPMLFRQLPGQALAAKIMDEFYYLDRGTLLIGEVNGKIRHARIVRHRREGMAAVSYLTPLWKGQEHRAFIWAAAKWVSEAGYSTVTSFVPETEWDSPAFQSFLRHGHIRLVQKHLGFDSPLYEVQSRLDDVLRQPIEQWVGAVHYEQ